MPIPLTHDEWEKEWRACFRRLRAKGIDLEQAQRLARGITKARYGPQPPGVPLWLRVAIKIVGKRMKLDPRRTGPMLQRFLVALVYGIAGCAPMFAAALQDAAISQSEWSALFAAFVAAFWGKFSSNQTFVAPDRAVWTPEERQEKQGQ